MSACSDHHLVKAGLKVKLTKTGVRMARRSQFDIEKIEEIVCAAPAEETPCTTRCERSCRGSS